MVKIAKLIKEFFIGLVKHKQSNWSLTYAQASLIYKN